MHLCNFFWTSMLHETHKITFPLDNPVLLPPFFICVLNYTFEHRAVFMETLSNSYDSMKDVKK